MILAGPSCFLILSFLYLLYRIDLWHVYAPFLYYVSCLRESLFLFPLLLLSASISGIVVWNLHLAYIHDSILVSVVNMPGWRNWKDATDLKFVDRKIMWVRLPPRALKYLDIRINLLLVTFFIRFATVLIPSPLGVNRSRKGSVNLYNNVHKRF